jgi:DNA-binding NarL/FixJ family response regulator
MSDRYRIILADDHVMVRRGLKRLLTDSADMEVVAEAGDGLELLKALQKTRADLIVLDLSMPNLRGLEAISEIKRLYPDSKVLILTMHKESAYLYRSLSAGADGYLLKEEAEDELFAAIDSIRGDKVYISPGLAQYSIRDLVNSRSKEKDLQLTERLTLREREILKLVAENKSNKEIAQLLSLSVRTVETHRYNIMSKLKIKGTAALVQYAMRKEYL